MAATYRGGRMFYCAAEWRCLLYPYALPAPSHHTVTLLLYMYMKRVFAALLILLVFSVPQALSQQSFSLSVTPPLFRLNIGPGQEWSSSIKVVNSNPYDITVYATVMNFTGQGEEGQGALTPVTEQDPEVTPYTLASW